MNKVGRGGKDPLAPSFPSAFGAVIANPGVRDVLEGCNCFVIQFLIQDAKGASQGRHWRI